MLGRPSAIDLPDVPAQATTLVVPPRRRLITWQAMSPRMLIGMTIIGVFLLLALTADFLTPYDPNYQDYATLLQGPSADHPFGTDQVGCDVYSRVVYGTRISFLVGVVAVGI